MRRLRFLILPLAAFLVACALVLLSERSGAQVTGGAPGMPYNQGPTTPSSCGAPMIFYNNTAPGTYSGCYANGTFGPFGSGGGGGGVTMLAQVGDLAVTKTTATQLTVCANCSTATPATVGFRWYSQQITGPALVNITTGTLTDFAYIYYVNGTGLVVGSPTMNASLSCTGCTVAGAAVSAFPTTSVPIAQVHATSGAWDAITAAMDSRDFLRTANVAGTAGVSCSDANGDLQCSADQSVTMYRTTVPGSLTGICTPNNFAMDTTNLYVCQASGNWLKFTSGAGTGTATPGPTSWITVTANRNITTADFSAFQGFMVTNANVTLTLPANTTQPPAGQCIVVLNLPAGVTTIARNGQNFNNQAAGNIPFAPGGGQAGYPGTGTVCSDGTNYFTSSWFGGFRGASGQFLTGQGNGAVTTSATMVTNVPVYGDAANAARAGQSLASGTGTVGNLACATGNNVDGNCTVTSAANFLGVFVTTNNFASEGQVTVNLDASSTVNFGDYICSSTTTAGLLHANSTTPCAANLQVAIAVASGTGVSTILASLRR